jgi:hypothetical protein
MMMPLVLGSFGVVLEVNERGKLFYKTLRDIMEIMYRHTFHLQYKNQSKDSRNKVIHKPHELFMEQWSMRPTRLTIEKTYNNKKKKI